MELHELSCTCFTLAELGISQDEAQSILEVAVTSANLNLLGAQLPALMEGSPSNHLWVPCHQRLSLGSLSNCQCALLCSLQVGRRQNASTTKSTEIACVCRS